MSSGALSFRDLINSNTVQIILSGTQCSDELQPDETQCPHPILTCPMNYYRIPVKECLTKHLCASLEFLNPLTDQQGCLRISKTDILIFDDFLLRKLVQN